jgi:hypothetical protein
MLVLALAGCSGHSAAKPCPPDPRLARLERDLATMKRAAKLPVKDALKGNAATNRATDRFLSDLETSGLDTLVQNRMIDHAAAALLGSCEQCFQALEAARPIPGIAHQHNARPCRSK